MRRLAVSIIAAFLALGLGQGAQAQSVVSTGQSFISGSLLPGMREDDGSRTAGLRLTLRDGWKTYWRSPGEAGVPPVFDWSGSENVASVEVLWPRPHVFESFGLQTVGYKGQVVLPLVVRPADPSLPMQLSLTADLGVCNDICVLEHFTLSETIAADERDIGAGQVRRARANVPPIGGAAGLDRATCRITGQGRERRLAMRLEFLTELEAPVVLVEGPEHAWISDVVSRQAGARAVEVEATISLASDAAWIGRHDLRATVLAGNLAADIRGCTAPAG